MSRNEIAKMSVEERVALMEELWASFDRDELEYPAPAWHEEILHERTQADSADFVPFEEAKASLYQRLDEYRNS
jgi:hypothetical protein